MSQPRPAKNRQPRRRRTNEYLHKSPAICIVVHDLHGNAMPDSDAAEILNLVTDLALSKGYVINFTRT